MINFPCLYDQIAGWLRCQSLIGVGEMVSLVIDMESSEYRRITTETLALLNWVRRLVDGLMPNVGEDN